MMELKPRNWLKHSQNWLIAHIMQEVPKDLSVCEFDCHETQCSQQKWLNCSRRYQ